MRDQNLHKIVYANDSVESRHGKETQKISSEDIEDRPKWSSKYQI